MCNIHLQTQQLRPCWSGAGEIVRNSALFSRMVNRMRIHKAVQTISKSDRRLQDRSVACVIAQQYSSATFVSLRHLYRKVKNSARFCKFHFTFSKTA